MTPYGPCLVASPPVAKKRPDERGAILVEFALVVFFVGIPMLIGGLFVFSAVIAKTQASGASPTASNFLAYGGCPAVTSGMLCYDGVTPSASCPAEHANGFTNFVVNDPTDTTDTATTLDPNSATAATLCEIDRIVGNSLFDTDPNSLQTAIYCSGYPVGESGDSCMDSSAVWVCVRAWDGNGLTNIIGPLWISSQSEQMVSPLGYPDGLGNFNTFYPANTYNGPGDPMTCGTATSPLPTTTTTTTGP